MRILVLGGTTEASTLARLLAGDVRFKATLSLAGRTNSPRPQPIATRIGGFGGASGLAAWLAAERVDAAIDATHPYAAQISANATEACRQVGIPLVSVVRPCWQPVAGDDWHVVASADAAALARGPFEREAERALLVDSRIEVVVTKNSGGTATFAKVEAARDLGLPVIMVRRPGKPAGHVVSNPEEALRWLAEGRSPSLRGV